ncbi:BrnT family toxin [Cronbergia sp. UHCC 0137]|uniref:BrnT family toxin n=1 Tax=Cronbergia sp. UHCC 0137 TaxID=3110239 RepID=UPI002B214379|nr:BrnT family toxin [Cronbergia sp. UHCC 0137]MEA5617027.1 BrnT family toxin [Cronbergia sp. UHCC 0137]
MQFEWDEAKNLENIRKHQIDFADVSEMFDSPMLIEEDERLGFLRNGVAVVIWTDRQSDVMRIISARKANRYERKKI